MYGYECCFVRLLLRFKLMNFKPLYFKTRTPDEWHAWMSFWKVFIWLGIVYDVQYHQSSSLPNNLDINFSIHAIAAIAVIFIYVVFSRPLTGDCLWSVSGQRSKTTSRAAFRPPGRVDDDRARCGGHRSRTGGSEGRLRRTEGGDLPRYTVMTWHPSLSLSRLADDDDDIHDRTFSFYDVK